MNVIYKPTESERSNCISIVKNFLKIDSDSECEKYADNILSVAYSIGGDYSEETLRTIVEALLK